VNGHLRGHAPEFTAGRENGRRRRPKGYADWRPQAKTRELLEQVNTVFVEYTDFLPLTVRQVFYRLVASFGYEKTEHAYNRLAEAIVRARRARLIEWDAIRDDGVVIYSPDFYDSVVTFWDDTGRRAKAYRRDRQAGQDYRVELWCEAAGMAPQLARVGNEFSVPVFSSGGFSSLTAVRSIVERARVQDVPTVLLHVGDFDPSGESIFQAMAEDAQAFLREDRLLALQELHPFRVALTAEQVDEYDLPTSPAKASDSRSAAWTGGTCQLEALAPDQLANLVEDAILAWFDEDTLQRQVDREHDDRDELLRQLPQGEA
jgi:hypothetical protein